ncbi:hypothetical protein Hanom_Chr14g01260111 [Helianthus anomalus]
MRLLPFYPVCRHHRGGRPLIFTVTTRERVGVGVRPEIGVVKVGVSVVGVVVGKDGVGARPSTPAPVTGPGNERGSDEGVWCYIELRIGFFF